MEGSERGALGRRNERFRIMVVGERKERKRDVEERGYILEKERGGRWGGVGGERGLLAEGDKGNRNDKAGRRKWA